MRRALLSFALAAAALVATISPAEGSICTAASTCYITGGSKKCNRAKTDCPPCLYKGFLSFSYDCYYLDDSGSCPSDTTYCPASSGSSSGSSGASTPATTTPAPTTVKPSSTTSKPSTKSSSGSGSSASAKTPTPTTKKTNSTNTSTPITLTFAPTSTTSPVATESASPLATSSPSSNQSSDSSSSNTKLFIIAGVAAGAVAVIAVLAFLVWKGRRDDDDDSDDEDFRFNPPKATYTGRAAPGGPGSVATTSSYNNSDQMRPQTSPSSRPAPHNYAGAAAVGGAVAGGYAASSHSSGNAPNQYSSGNRYDQYAAPSGAPPTYSAAYASGGVQSMESQDSLPDSPASSGDRRDVWGNTVGPTSHTAAASGAASSGGYKSEYRDKRTLSNVSVEF